MWAVLAEDWSDVDAIVVLLKRISGIDNQKIFRKGFNGCGALRTKACRIMGEFSTKGATRFIICHDSDGVDVGEIKAKFVATLNDPRCAGLDHQVIVPVQELEAWIIADESAIKRAIPSLSIRNVSAPESLASPKEWLVNESRRGRSKPLFVPSLHNKLVASFIDLAKLERKCPSFLELRKFVKARLAMQHQLQQPVLHARRRLYPQGARNRRTGRCTDLAS